MCKIIIAPNIRNLNSNCIFLINKYSLQFLVWTLYLIVYITKVDLVDRNKNIINSVI